MDRDPRYDVLFEPVPIGPVTARNRFYQVPHCNGMGFAYPRSHAAMREMKAEGGWAVVCTEECMIHPTADATPYSNAVLWDDGDIAPLALMVEAVHRHGALAGCELVHNGTTNANRFSREAPLAPSPRPADSFDPLEARAMDKADIRAFRRWHRDAALRAKRAGCDIVYIYAAHDIAVPMHFISRRRNRRTDAYGGSLENRVRLLRELIEDTRDAVGDRCGVVVRFAVDELLGDRGITSQGEGREVIEMLAELPDMWDVNVSDWNNDSATSRFAPEGAQESHVAFVKSVTSKPVVGVGRFTSPDLMVSLVRRGVLDMIGAARPSIADPFLPRKIEEGRPDDIRECIGCNVCIAGTMTAAPMRCTQNPTVGEEWRRGWHPERIEPKGSEAGVLVVGAGPAGLECARALGQRGYGVGLAEATVELGGRLAAERRLPGFAEWGRVADHRVYQIGKMANVSVWRDSRLTADDIREYGAARVVIATGAGWRRDGVGRRNFAPVEGWDRPGVITPEDVFAGVGSTGPAVVFDDDHYYLGGALAEKLRRDGLEVTLVTPAAEASAWTVNTLEQERIQRRLIELGVAIAPHRDLTGIADDEIELACVFTERRSTLPCATLVMVTSRLPDDELYHDLMREPDALAAAGIETVTRIGDCYAPGTIAAAVHSGHRYARELDAPPPGDVPFRRERTAIGDA